MKHLSMAVLVLLLAGCASLGGSGNGKGSAKALPTDAVREERGYSLLYDLLGQEKDVDKILSIKSVSKGTGALIKDVAAVSGKAHARLEKLVKLAPVVRLGHEDLPAVEKATREAIAFHTAVDLVVSGKSFEVRLLLTQAQALRYGEYLAKELEKTDKNEERSKWLGALAKEYAALFDKVVARLAPVK